MEGNIIIEKIQDTKCKICGDKMKKYIEIGSCGCMSCEMNNMYEADDECEYPENREIFITYKCLKCNNISN